MNLYRKYIKRFLDILLSLIAIIILSPILIVTSFLVWNKLGTPILFTQKRPGENEKIFKMYKFRSMTDERDEHGELLPDSRRLSKFGKFLRSTSLDELPGLWNILKGDMSIVGPRPLLVRYLPFYTNEEKIRHSVKPGLTGLAQVKGRNNLGWDDRLAFDVKYVNEISIYLDFKIIYNTVKKVIKKEDITIVDLGSLKSLDVERKTDIGNSEIEY